MMPYPLLKTIIVALCFCSTLALVGCKEEIELHTRLSESDANEVMAALIENRIPAHKLNTKEGVTVFIDQADIAGAVRILQAKGLPRKNKTSMGEVFQKEGIISSPLEERARYIYALSQELEYTFSQIAGVVVARVHVVLPEKVAPGEPIQPSSAAVFIKHQDELDPDVALPKIKRMVASSIPGLAEAGNDAIAVVFMPTHASHRPLKSQLMAQFEQEMGQSFFEEPRRQSGTHYTLNIAIGLVIMSLLIAATVLRKQLFRKK